MTEYCHLATFPFGKYYCPAILRADMCEIVFVTLKPQDMTPNGLVEVLEALRDTVNSGTNKAPIQCVVFYFFGENTCAIPLAGNVSIEGAQKIATCILANALPDSDFEEGAPDIGKQLSSSARLLVHTYLELASNIN